MTNKQLFDNDCFLKLDSSVFDNDQVKFDCDVSVMIEKIGLHRSGMIKGETTALHIDQKGRWFQIVFWRGYLDVYLLGTEKECSHYFKSVTFGELRNKIKELISKLTK